MCGGPPHAPAECGFVRGSERCFGAFAPPHWPEICGNLAAIDRLRPTRSATGPPRMGAIEKPTKNKHHHRAAMINRVAAKRLSRIDPPRWPESRPQGRILVRIRPAA